MLQETTYTYPWLRNYPTFACKHCGKKERQTGQKRVCEECRKSRKQTARRRRDGTTYRCEECGLTKEIVKSKRRFCPDCAKIRRARRGKKYFEKKVFQRVCVVCAKSFEASLKAGDGKASYQRTTCSDKCRAVKARQKATKTCKHCGKPFYRVGSIGCSPECSQAIRNETKTKKQWEEGKIWKCRCFNCLGWFEYRPFSSKSKTKGHFCSRECAYQNASVCGRIVNGELRNRTKWAQWAAKHEAEKRRTATNLEKDLEKKWNGLVSIWRACICCDDFHGGGRKKCVGCLSKERQKKRKAATKQKKCVICGTEFVGGNRKTCSASCSDLQRLRVKNNYHMRWRTKHLPDQEDVDWVEVMARDNWICYLCGQLTDRYTKYEPGSPEAEHVTPLSRGGAHAYSNLRCSCRACNAAKGVMTLEEYLVSDARKRRLEKVTELKSKQKELFYETRIVEHT